MQSIFNELFNHYSRFVPEAEPLQEIENAHQSLIRSLEKPERKLVLRLTPFGSDKFRICGTAWANAGICPAISPTAHNASGQARTPSDYVRECCLDKEIRDIAHCVRQHKKRTVKAMETPNPYSGLIFCADCGKLFNLHRAHTMAESRNNVMCSIYKHFGKEECSSHYLRESQLEAVILDDRKRVTHFARQDESMLAECINRKNTAATRKEITTAPQDIWVHYRDIGMLSDVKEEFDIPSMEDLYGVDYEIPEDGLEPAFRA